MKKSTKSVVQFIILLSIGLLLVWLSLKQVAPQKDNIINAFRNADYFWVIVSMLVSLLSHVLRAYRWNYLLKPLRHKVKFMNANAHVLVGYFANYGIPRMGEVTRCTLAAKYDHVPFEIGFGTVITERIIDFLLFVVIFFLTLFFQFTNLIGLANDLIFSKVSAKMQNLTNSPVMFTLLLLSIAGFVTAFVLYRKKIGSLLKGKLGGMVKGLGEGIGSIRKLDKPVEFVVLSLLIWACYLYSLYLCFFAIPGTSQLGQGEALTLLLFGTFGVMFSPGGLGAYPLILSGILVSTYHVDEVSAFAFPWLAWSSQFILIVVLGIISLIVLPLINKNRNVVS